MSQENVEIFKRAVETWNRDDFEAWIDLFDPEFEWHASEIAQLLTFRGGKIASSRDFMSHAEALEAAGLRE
jgi:ketosteroid isomerase-like protein